MKIAIVFYSFSGNTRKAAQFIQNNLKEDEVDLIDLQLKEDVRSFLKQCHHAFIKKIPEIQEAALDLASYDYIIFASPVWAFTIAPALRTYLSKVSGLENKKTGCFVTYGSGTGSAKTLKELEDMIREKGGKIMFSKRFSGYKTKNENYLNEQFKLLLEILS
jgi:flavodoxin